MKIILETEHPVAVESPDHLKPWGTKRDNSKCPRFLKKVSRLFNEQRDEFSLLDIGCSGGGWVREAHDKGWLAVGLEGSDLSKRIRRAEWAVIPDNLFTCDVTKPFRLSLEDGPKNIPLAFSVITAWELIEHIAEPDLPQVFRNAAAHLRPGGLFIMSVSPNEEVIDGVRLHQTVRQRDWWIKTAAENGFTHLDGFIGYFNGHFVRGPKYNAPGSFHLVLSPSPAMAPAVPRLGRREKILDAWLESRPHLLVREAVIGDALR
jgi:SAM-dependent methyltransferase